jgi:cell division ATPase FtsA
LAHPDIKHQRIIEQKRIIKDKIYRDDIRHLSNIVADVASLEKYETVKLVPMYRTIDEQQKVKNPIGIVAKKLDLVADIFSLPSDFYETLLSIIETLDIYVADIVPNTIATPYAVLDYDAKDL